MQEPAPRYAIYFTPRPLSPLAHFGAGILGYDSFEKADVPHLELRGIPAAELVTATAAPRRYGFHATLVAPFHLGDKSESHALDALDRFCSLAAPLKVGRLNVQMMQNFVALKPAAANPSLDELAHRCVEYFDPLRRLLGAADFARRNNGDLSDRQRAYLDRWGYPYVFKEFRFHMTLTGPLTGDNCRRFHAALADAYQSLADHVLDIDAVSLMRQESRESRFEVIARRTLHGNAGFV